MAPSPSPLSVVDGELEDEFAPERNMTPELVRAHLRAFAARGATRVALRDATSKLELGAWSVASADPSAIVSTALDLVRGQGAGRMQLAFTRKGGEVDSVIYDIEEPPAKLTDAELMRDMLRESHEHIRELHDAFAKLTRTQTEALRGFWGVLQQQLMDSHEERARLLEELTKRQAEDGDAGARAMRLVELFAPHLAPQLGTLVGAAAMALSSRRDHGSAKEEEEEQQQPVRGSRRESEGAGIERRDGETSGEGVGKRTPSD